MAFRFIAWYHYVGDIVNIWHWILGVLTLLPLDGMIAGVYGFWSREKHIAFTVGFLPSTISLIVTVIPIIQNITYFSTPYVTYIHFLVFFRAFYLFGGCAVGMGLMGFGLAKWKESGKSISFWGFILWLFTLMTSALLSS